MIYVIMCIYIISIYIYIHSDTGLYPSLWRFKPLKKMSQRMSIAPSWKFWPRRSDDGFFKSDIWLLGSAGDVHGEKSLVIWRDVSHGI